MFTMHPLDLSPRTNSIRSTYYSAQSSVQSGAFGSIGNHNSDHETGHKVSNKSGNKREQEHGKRGRPRADILTTLMFEGSSSRSKIRCMKCSRAFPREKSLQAHMRTHTGERPYLCDYPGCSKAFCQSGQLKTHQRLHTGEKPFACNVEGCESRFTHANRHCASHPYAGLRRLKVDWTHVARLNDQQSNAEVKKWIEKYIKQSKEKFTSKAPSRKSSVQETSTKRSSTHEKLPKKSVIQETTSAKQISLIYPVEVRGRKTSHRLGKKIIESSSSSLTLIGEEDKNFPLDLTRNKYSPSLPPLSPITPPPHSTNPGPPPPLIPIIHELSAPMPYALTSHNSRNVTSSAKSLSPEAISYSCQISTALSSYSSASSSYSSASSSSSSSSVSSSTTSSISSLYRQHFANYPASERKDDFYPYVLSSQLILQGPSNLSNTYYSQCIPLPANCGPVSSPVPENTKVCVKAKETEKDRYISALALIELSKG